MAKKKSFVVNVNIQVPIEAYSTVVAEIKVREMLRFGLHNTDWVLVGLIVEEDEDERLD